MEDIQRLYSQIKPKLGQEKSNEGQEFSHFQNYRGIIVLGEPGIGKTFAFKKEAAQCSNGHYVNAIEFNSTVQSQLKKRFTGKTLFIDGLDEARVWDGSKNSALAKLIDNIDQSENVNFRVSCRSLEWDENNINAIRGVVSESDLAIIILQPLNFPQIYSIVEKELEKPEEFLKQAHLNRFIHLFGIPQNLEMMISIYKNGGTITCRKDLFEKACEELSKEFNKVHGKNNTILSRSQSINLAGKLCAIQLLTNKIGFSVIDASEDDNFFSILNIDDTDSIEKVAKTRLFSQGGFNQFQPSHRTIAEYLAANYLIGLFRDGYPYNRIIQMIKGTDGGIYSDLRGLYAWLLTLYPEKRDHLIINDPLCVLVYGDISDFTGLQKKKLFELLRERSVEHPWFHSETQFNEEIGNLICSELEEDIVKVLESDFGNVNFLTFILEALNVSEVPESTVPYLKNIVENSKHKRVVRKLAMGAFCKIKPVNIDEIKSILNKLNEGQIEDRYSEIRGEILNFLYPEHLSVIECLRFIVSEPQNLYGSYTFFLQNFVKKTPKSQFSNLMEAIGKEPNDIKKHLLLEKIYPKLFLPFLEEFGMKTSGQHLYSLIIGTNYSSGGHFFRRSDQINKIKAFYRDNPKIYLKLFKYWLDNIDHGERKYPNTLLFHRNIHFHEDCYPKDFGKWILNKARESLDPIIKEYLFQKLLFKGCFYKYFNSPSFDELAIIKDVCNEFTKVFKRSIVCPLEDVGIQEIDYENDRKKREIKIQQEEFEFLQKNLERIRTGELPDSLYNIVNKYLFEDNRLNNYDSSKIYEIYPANYCDAILEGLENLIKNKNIPSLNSVAHANLKNQVLQFGLPFMFGCRITREKNIDWFKNVSDEVIEFALATYWVCDYYDLGDKDWIYEIIDYQPELFFKVVDVITGLEFLYGTQDAIGLRKLIAEQKLEPFAIELIPGFVKKYKKISSENLSRILYFLWKQNKLGEIKVLIEERLKETTDEIKDLWQAINFISDPKRNQATYKSYLKESFERAQGLVNILNPHFVPAYSNISIDNLELNKQIIEILGCIVSPVREPNEIGYMYFEKNIKVVNFVSSVIEEISLNTSPDAETILKKLSKVNGIKSWHPAILNALKVNIQNRQKNDFKPYSVKEVLNILDGGKPKRHGDLKEFIKDHLENLASEYRGSSSNSNQKFWNLESKKSHDEDYCRDRIMEDLDKRLAPQSMHTESEGTHKAKKRSDFKIVCGNLILPIEIKKNSNKELWTGINDQLIAQYSIDPKAAGFGVFVALWFGPKEQCASRKIEKAKPKNPAELKIILEDLVPVVSKFRIDVVVFDLSLSVTSREKRTPN